MLENPRGMLRFTSQLDLSAVPTKQRASRRFPFTLAAGEMSRWPANPDSIFQVSHNMLFVLMDNHVHLLLTPQAEGDVARLMQKLGRQYVGQFNVRHRRTGTLWEGRYKACLVDQLVYLLRCHCYIDLNPVRARITDDATQFRWSSAAAHCGLRCDALLTSHTAYSELSHDSKGRGDAYQTLLREAISDDDLQIIHDYLKQQRALGRDDFRAMVEAKTQRFAGIRPAHRPSQPKCK
jgi:putative transposase